VLTFGILAQAGEEGFHLPGGAGEWAVWLVFAAVVAGLWWVVRRTRRRAQDQYWERKRREEAERKRLLGEP
jgi:predicted LPLAT superfamily acyltransferase